MVDQIFDRAYQAGREPLNEGIERGLASIANSIGTTFRVLQAIQFAAPWDPKKAHAPSLRQDAGCA